MVRLMRHAMTTMKRSILSLLLAVTPWVAANAGPLQRQHVASDTKWVLHLDLDAFRTTQVGAEAVRGKLGRDMAKAQADLKTYLDFDFDWAQIHSLTAYGFDFAPKNQSQGVLLIATSLDVQKGLEAAITKQAEASVENGNVRRLADSPVAVYSIRNEFLVALPPGNPVVLAKTDALLQKGLAVLAGRHPNLASTAVFTDFPPQPNAVVFVGMAEGFNANTPVPPQARVFQMADGGRLALGETGNQVFVAATLKAKSSEVSAQMQQILQGLLALGALGQPQNQELQQLIQAARVSVNDRFVSIEVQLPATTVIQKMQEKERR